VLAVATKMKLIRVCRLEHQSRRRNPVQQIYLNKQRGSQILLGWV